MKIPFKAIAVLIILSLIGVFAYQAYWLTGLYSSMKKDMDNCLAETLQVSDYNEMMARCDSLKRNSNIDKYIKSSFEVDSIMTHAGNSYGIHIPNRIGLEINEMPVLAPRMKQELEPGMVFALEPKIVLPDIGPVGIENSWVVTTEGLEKLTLCGEEIVEL